MLDALMLPQPTRNPRAWTLTLLLAVCAWLVTLHQTLSMFSLRMYGTMGLALGPFLLFWTIMMAAMMLPALAPFVSLRLADVQLRAPRGAARGVRLALFLLGYLCIWSLCGLPVFLLCLLADGLVVHAPALGIGLGVLLLTAAGLYQLTPLKRLCLTHCEVISRHHGACAPSASRAGGLSDLGGGLRHGLYCVGCCGALMLVLIAVGLMNLPWMLLISALVFLERVWKHGQRLRFLLGLVLIFYGLLAYVVPSLLSGLYSGHF